jgi:hypothetical protein
MLAVVLQILKCHAHTLKKSAQVFPCRVSHDKKEKKRDPPLCRQQIALWNATSKYTKNTFDRFLHIRCPPNLENFWDCLAKKRIEAR